MCKYCLEYNDHIEFVCDIMDSIVIDKHIRLPTRVISLIEDAISTYYFSKVIIKEIKKND